MLGFRYLKVSPTTHVIQFKNGRPVREGVGLAFYYYEPSSVIVQVPVGSVDVPFVFEEVTADFQAVTIQGELTYRVVNATKLPVTVKTRLGWDEAHKEIVDITDADGLTTTVYFSTLDKLPVRQLLKRRNEQFKDFDSEETIFAKYRDVGGGVKWPRLRCGRLVGREDTGRRARRSCRRAVRDRGIRQPAAEADRHRSLLGED